MPTAAQSGRQESCGTKGNWFHTAAALTEEWFIGTRTPRPRPR
ncbi:hypothetical protein CGRA01v4_04291 [Colletotrichum graminicola]|nr:hypothetical protein CGRA01v4_04291 [Colletotrichum graminicola]